MDFARKSKCHLRVVVLRRAPSARTKKNSIAHKGRPFSECPLESMRSGGAIPPPPPKRVSQEYSRNTLWRQDKTRAILAPLRYDLERVLDCIARYGSVIFWCFRRPTRQNDTCLALHGVIGQVSSSCGCEGKFQGDSQYTLNCKQLALKGHFESDTWTR